MPLTRDDFPKPTVDALCKRAAYICSNPDCRVHTLAPSGADDGRFLYIGKAAHICAAADGGPRYEYRMSPEERSAPANGIFLCGSCADLIDKNSGADFSIELLHRWKTDHEKWVSENLNKRGTGRGGEGGGGTIVGDRGTIIGGHGGGGGTHGIGGKGGSGFIQGNDGVIIGGDGGSCPSRDGRGGKGARGPTERLGFPTQLWGFGRGGAGPNHPEYDRRITLLRTVRTEYQAKFPERVPFIESGVEPVPVDWINQRLQELNEGWRVETGPQGYLLPALSESGVQ
jgi:hypothetical protein